MGTKLVNMAVHQCDWCEHETPPTAGEFRGQSPAREAYTAYPPPAGWHTLYISIDGLGGDAKPSLLCQECFDCFRGHLTQATDARVKK